MKNLIVAKPPKQLRHFWTDCGKAFCFDMSDMKGLAAVAGGQFFMFHHGLNMERRNLDISEKYIGATKTQKGARSFLAKLIASGKEPKYMPYPEIPIKETTHEYEN